VILASWQRSLSQGVSPDPEASYWQNFDLGSRLVRAAGPVLDRLMATGIADTDVNVTLVDGAGTLLQRRFGRPPLAHLGQAEVEPGFRLSEAFSGTSGVSLALAERRPGHVFGPEHFAGGGQSNACLASPVRDPLSGRIEGAIDFCVPISQMNGALQSLVRMTAEAIEGRLLEHNSARERALLAAYLRARRRALAGAGGANGRLISIEDVAGSALNGHEQMILMEKAAELISSGSQTALEVLLPGGQRVTLLGRPLATPSGVAGVAVEAFLPGGLGQERPPVPNDVADAGAGQLGPRQHASVPVMTSMDSVLKGAVPGPGADRVEGSEPTGRGSSAPAGGVGELLLVGEPEVGGFAVAARRRLELLSEASARIGTTLNVSRTAQELAETAVPRFADYVTVDLPEAVLRGENSPDPSNELIRTVAHGVRDTCPFYPVGQQVHFLPVTPQARCLATGQAVLEADLRATVGWRAQDVERSQGILDHEIHSLLAVPLRARGGVLGIAAFYRSQGSQPFSDDDRTLAEEFATRAAVCIDNARRYTREHTMVLALQRSLLPQGLPENSAVETASRYLPAESGVGGDWFDVIPLSGTRVALVVGDVVGHGLHAAATMGRLRTAVHNFAALDLAPDELLTHLDTLVSRLDREESGDNEATPGAGVIGATCLYAVYDPTNGTCTLSRAGHPPPALVDPHGTVTFPELPAGPPLGLGGLPFETAEIRLLEGSKLVLYTDGLIEHRHRDVDTVLDRLRRVLASPDASPEQTCQAVQDAVVPDKPDDDIALLVARTHVLDADHVASWDLPADPAAVAGLRLAAAQRLTDWGLGDAAFATELVLSELATNAIRYGTTPIRVQLLRDRTLICEVSDGSNTSPHLRRAATTDEGGRGLFLVAQLTQAWGTRYTQTGKVIWAEQHLPGMTT
jgi:serine phosphatase RsbU (regulator of sigma subunit)/anti-sigma regulatory factor (Ser/Thr protein kinase)